MTVKIASAQYDIGYFNSIDDYRSKITGWVNDACREGALMLVFPEYFSMELTSLLSKAVQRDLSAQLVEMQAFLDDFRNLFCTLAQANKVYIQAGSFPVAVAGSEYRNRAYLYGPGGEIGYQDKLIMTRFEDEQWRISASPKIMVFSLPFADVGINICYDSEFPLLAREQAEAGVQLILVPSCTDSLAGFHRVEIGCRARALENQCYVVQAAVVGEAPWSPAVDENWGRAAVYTPVDRGFPADGIASAGQLNQPQWVYACVDFKDIDAIRGNGQVANYRDWPKQYGKSIS